MKASQTGNVLTLREEINSADWTQWIMLRADAHHDSPYCDRALERRQLDLAKEVGAWIMDFGDCLDAMQGKFDPRRSYKDIRPEDLAEDYYDRVVAHAARDYYPYRDNWLLFAKGNHEQGVLKHTNHCITTALVTRLGAGHVGGYGGWVRLMFTAYETISRTINIKYFHGSGKGGGATKGTGQSNRQAVYVPDAHIVVNGHTHDAWVLSIARERLSRKGTVTRDNQLHVRVPGYKDEYGDGSGGYIVEKGSEPKPLGCIWLKLWWDSTLKDVCYTAMMDVR